MRARTMGQDIRFLMFVGMMFVLLAVVAYYAPIYVAKGFEKVYKLQQKNALCVALDVR